MRSLPLLGGTLEELVLGVTHSTSLPQNARITIFGPACYLLNETLQVEATVRTAENHTNEVHEVICTRSPHTIDPLFVRIS